MSKCSMSILYN